mgnify:CR=1 FL=1
MKSEIPFMFSSSLDMYGESETPYTQHRRLCLFCSSKIDEGERKFIFNLVIPRRYRLGTRINITTPASSRGVITESFNHPPVIFYHRQRYAGSIPAFGISGISHISENCIIFLLCFTSKMGSVFIALPPHAEVAVCEFDPHNRHF